jgi:hypothetical protein
LHFSIIRKHCNLIMNQIISIELKHDNYKVHYNYSSKSLFMNHKGNTKKNLRICLCSLLPKFLCFQMQITAPLCRHLRATHAAITMLNSLQHAAACTTMNCSGFSVDFTYEIKPLRMKMVGMLSIYCPTEGGQTPKWIVRI